MTSDPKQNAKVAISPMEQPDWPEVRAIYEEGIATGNATFETSALDWESWNAKHIEAGRLVARRDGKVLGWVALSPVSSRCVYSGVAEVSIYVAAAARGRGLARHCCRLPSRLRKQKESGPSRLAFFQKT